MKKIEKNNVSKVFVLFLIQIITGFSIIVAMLALFLEITNRLLNREIIYFDTSIIQYVYTYRNDVLTHILRIASFMGGEIFLGAGIVVTILSLRKRKREFYLFACILVFGILLNLFLKGMFHRPRPDFLPLVYETTYSFPSGHAMNSLVFYGTLVFLYFHITRNRRMAAILGIVFTLLIAVIGFSRVYLGAHYPSDVLAGFAAGTCWLVMGLFLEKTLPYYYRKKV